MTTVRTFVAPVRTWFRTPSSEERLNVGGRARSCQNPHGHRTDVVGRGRRTGVCGLRGGVRPGGALSPGRGEPPDAPPSPPFGTEDRASIAPLSSRHESGARTSTYLPAPPRWERSGAGSRRRGAASGSDLLLPVETTRLEAVREVRSGRQRRCGAPSVGVAGRCSGQASWAAARASERPVSAPRLSPNTVNLVLTVQTSRPHAYRSAAEASSMRSGRVMKRFKEVITARTPTSNPRAGRLPIRATGDDSTRWLAPRHLALAWVEKHEAAVS